MLLISQLYAMKGLLLLAIVILFVVNKLRTYRRLQTFKGPFSSGWSNFWHSRVILNTRSYLVYDQVNKKYGKLFTLAAAMNADSFWWLISSIRPNCQSWTQ